MLLVHWGDCKCYQPCHSRFNFVFAVMFHCLLLFVEQNKLIN